MHGSLNQIQWNKLRPFHGSDSGEQTKLGKQNNFAQFCKTKRSSISGVSIQKLSLCEAQFRPVPIWCKYPASPWPNCNCAIDNKRVLFFLQNSYLILTLANGLILSWYIYHFGACCCLWLYMRGNDIGGPIAYIIYPHHYQIYLKMFVQYNIVHLDQCLNLVEVFNLVSNLSHKRGERNIKV